MNIKKHLKSYVVSFLTTFFVYIICYTLVRYLLFNHNDFYLSHVLVFLLVSMISSICLTLILSINNIHIILQSLIIYLILIISVYFIGFLTGMFYPSLKFWILSIIINIICLMIVLAVVIIRRFNTNKKLNESLKNFKERDKNEK